MSLATTADHDALLSRGPAPRAAEAGSPRLESRDTISAQILGSIGDRAQAATRTGSSCQPDQRDPARREWGRWLRRLRCREGADIRSQPTVRTATCGGAHVAILRCPIRRAGSTKVARTGTERQAGLGNQHESQGPRGDPRPWATGFARHQNGRKRLPTGIPCRFAEPKSDEPCEPDSNWSDE